MLVHDHIKTYTSSLSGMFGSRAPVWEQPLQDSLPQTFTKAQRGILLNAATPILRSRFEEAINPRQNFDLGFKNVDEGFRHCLLNAFADGVRQDLNVVSIWCNPTMPKSIRENGIIFRNLVDMQFNMEEIVDNYRLICGNRITPQFSLFLSYLELEYLPELQKLISEAEAEMHLEGTRQIAVTKALENEAKTHLRRIDPAEWQRASLTRNELS